MTWRAIWGEPLPEHADHATEAEAHAFALRKSRDEGCEVAVIAIPGPERGLGAPQPPSGVCADVRYDKRGAKRLPRWMDLFGIDPDYCEGRDVNEWLDDQRGEA